MFPTVLSEAADVGGAGQAVETYVDVNAIIALVKTGVAGVFDIASSAFGFLMDNPLCAFMVCVGFGSVALGMVRRALRIAKRT